VVRVSTTSSKFAYASILLITAGNTASFLINITEFYNRLGINEGDAAGLD